MRSTDDLFVLIKSLSRSEKRYFKLFAGRQCSDDGSDYIRLFDALDAMEEYDEERLRGALREEQRRYLPQAKYYLYKTILRALNQYNAGTDVEYQLDELLQSAMVLYRKHLHGQCRKLLAKVRRIAVENDYSHHLLRALRIEYRLAIIESHPAGLEERIDELFAEMVEIGDEVALRYRYWRVQAKMFLLEVQAATVRDHEHVERAEKLMSDPLIASGEEPRDPLTRLYYYFAYDHYYDITSRQEDLYEIRRKIVGFIESTPRARVRLADRYVPALYNFCQVLIQTRRFAEYERVYGTLRDVVREVKVENPSFNDFTIRLLEPRMLFQQGRLPEAAASIASLEEEFAECADSLRIGFAVYYRYLCAYIHFSVGDYARSLRWLNEIINRKSESHSELECYARVLNLVVHYELGHQGSIESFAGSASRFLAKRRRAFRFESILVTLIRKLAAAPTKREERELLAEARGELVALRNDRFEQPAFAHFDALSWVVSRLTGSSFAESYCKGGDMEAEDAVVSSSNHYDPR